MNVRQISSILFLGLTACAFAQTHTVVRWHQIVGVITAPAVDNPIGGVTDAGGNKTDVIHSGAGPWSARGGAVRIDLSTGEGSFSVEGLVLIGGNASGTPGPVTSVVGTLVCNPGATGQAILDTAATDLSRSGDAALSFRLNVPSACANPVFLIRAPQAGLKWIATGAVIGSDSGMSGY